MPEPNPLPLYEVLEEEYVSLHGPLPSSHYKKSPEERLKDIYKHIHALEKKRAAICISGGGIRSATFALGVFRASRDSSCLKSSITCQRSLAAATSEAGCRPGFTATPKEPTAFSAS